MQLLLEACLLRALVSCTISDYIIVLCTSLFLLNEACVATQHSVCDRAVVRWQMLCSRFSLLGSVEQNGKKTRIFSASGVNALAGWLVTWLHVAEESSRNIIKSVRKYLII